MSIGKTETFGLQRPLGIDPAIDISLNGISLGGLTINGEIKLKMTDFEHVYDLGKNAILPSLVLFKVVFNSEGSELTIVNSSSNNNNLTIKDKTLLEIPLQTFLIPIPIPTPFGIIVVDMPFDVTFELKGLGASTNGKLTLDNPISVNASLGFEFYDGQWTNISDVKITNEFTQKPIKDLFDPSVNFQMNVLEPAISIKPSLYDFVSASIGEKNEFNATIQTVSPNYLISLSTSPELSFEADFSKYFTNIKAESSLKIISFADTLAVGDFDTTKPAYSDSTVTQNRDSSGSCTFLYTFSQSGLYAGAAAQIVGADYSVVTNLTFNYTMESYCDNYTGTTYMANAPSSANITVTGGNSALLEFIDTRQQGCGPGATAPTTYTEIFYKCQ
jgi:hypothetical protein